MNLKVEKNFTDMDFEKEEWKLIFNTQKKFPKKSVIFKQGDPIDCFCRIESGVVTLKQKNKGQIVKKQFFFYYENKIKKINKNKLK